VFCRVITLAHFGVGFACLLVSLYMYVTASRDAFVEKPGQYRIATGSFHRRILLLLYVAVFLRARNVRQVT
jgi:hypothetical protein